MIKEVLILVNILTPCVNFLDLAFQKENSVVLVYCQIGVSRSLLFNCFLFCLSLCFESVFQGLYFTIHQIEDVKKVYLLGLVMQKSVVALRVKHKVFLQSEILASKFLLL